MEHSAMKTEFRQRIEIGPAWGKSLEDFPVRLEMPASYEPIPEEKVQFSFALDEENEQHLEFTRCPGHKTIYENGEFCAYLRIPFLSCEEETVVWLFADEDIEGNFIDPDEFWKGLSYIHEPEIFPKRAGGLRWEIFVVPEET